MKRRTFIMRAALAPIAVPAIALLSVKRDAPISVSWKSVLPATLPTMLGPATLITEGPYASGHTYATALGPRNYDQIINNDWGKSAQPVVEFGDSMFMKVRNGLG